MHSKSAAGKSFSGNNFLFPFLLVCISLSVFVRVRFINLPLERDEGEYAYSAQMLLRNFSLYTDVYTMKFPGTHLCYLFIEKFFGQTVPAIRHTLLVMNLLSIFLLYTIAKNWLNKSAALFASGCYCLLTLNTSVEGIIANAEQFVIVFTLIGLAILQIALRKNSWWLFFVAGISLGLSFMMKQHGFVFLLFALLWISIEHFKNNRWKIILKKFLLVIAGSVLPFLFLFSWLYAAGSLQKFYELTILYATDYVTQFHFYYGLRTRFNFFPILLSNPVIWLMVVTGLILIWILPSLREKRILLTLLTIITCIGVIPGYYFRPHYFNLILPAASLLAGAAFYALELNSARRQLITTAMCILILGSSCFISREFYFQNDIRTESLQMYDLQIFTVAEELGKYLQQNSSDTDRIAVIASEPELFFYARRISATRLIYMYPLMENQRYQKEMTAEFISQINSSRSKFLVFDDDMSEWFSMTESGRAVLENYRRLAKSDYEICGVVENYHHPVFRMALHEDSAEPEFRDRLILLRRKNS